MSTHAMLPAAMTGVARPSARRLGTWLLLAPRNLLIAIMQVYRRVVSPTYGDVCKYYPSCSAYAVGALQQHGAAGGVARTAARLARCHPWAVGGVDDVVPRRGFAHDLTRHGFVVPSPVERTAP